MKHMAADKAVPVTGDKVLISDSEDGGELKAVPIDQFGGSGIPAPATPAQGDVLYYNGTAWINLGPGTSGQYLKTQGAAANPVWADLPVAGGAIPAPATPEQGDVLYYNGSDWVVLNHGTDGQLLKTQGAAANPVWVDAPTGGGLTWSEVTGTSQAMAVDTGYIANNASQVALALPTTCAVGKVLAVVGKGAGGWKITQAAGQKIHFGDTATTTGTIGYITNNRQRDAMELVCTTADTEFALRGMPTGGLAADGRYMFLTHGDGTSLTDEMGHTITAYGDMAPSATQYKVGSKSWYFDGANDYCTVAYDSRFNLAGDFTVEWWEYRTASVDNTCTISRNLASVYAPWFAGYQSSGGAIQFYATSNGSSFDIASGKSMGTLALNTWVHRAVCRSGSTWWCWEDGVQTSTWTSSGTIQTTTDPLYFGRWYNNPNYYYFPGYVDEMAIMDYAKYTEAFTPSTTAIEATIDIVALLTS